MHRLPVPDVHVQAGGVMATAAGRDLRILVADDDAMVREAYRAFFARTDGFELVGEATDGDEAFDAYVRLRPDCVLMDLQMPGASGVRGIHRITQAFPDACCVALTTFGGQDYVVAALRAGASGYLLKDAGADALRAAIRQAVAGEMPLSPSVRQAVVASVCDGSGPMPGEEAPHLTAREAEVLSLVAGLSNAQIAARLFLSEGAVKQHLTRIGHKLGVTSRTQIVVRAIQVGLLDPNELDVGD